MNIQMNAQCAILIPMAIGQFSSGKKNADDRNRRPVLTSETTKRKTLIMFRKSWITQIKYAVGSGQGHYNYFLRTVNWLGYGSLPEGA